MKYSIHRNFKLRWSIAIMLFVLLTIVVPTGSVYAEIAAQDTWEGEITGNLTDINFSNYTFVTDTLKEKTIDKTFIGVIGVEAGRKEATIETLSDTQKVLRLKAITADINTYKGVKLTDNFGMECKVKFGDNTSARELGGMKGIAAGVNNSWPTPILFTADGKIQDSQKNQVGTYQADTWYTIKIEVDTKNQQYKALIDDGDPNNLIYVQESLNVNGSGDKIWRGCANTYMWKQKWNNNSATSYIDIAYIKAGKINKVWNKVITGSLTGLDFSNYEFATDTPKEKTIDKTFIGTIGVETGIKEATIETLSDAQKVLRLKALTADINTYKGGLKLTDNFGVECKVKFGDNTSARELGGMKGIAAGVNNSWPTPILFTADGKIQDSQKKEVGTYQADIWYTIKIEVDTKNQQYMALIDDGDPNNLIYVQESLNVNGSGDKIWRGCAYAYMWKQRKSNNPVTSYIDIAYMKAGKVQPMIQSIQVNDMDMNVGAGIILNPSVIPQDAYCGDLEYTSNDPSVVKVFENGLLALKAGEAQITVTEPVSGKNASFKVTVSEPIVTWEFKEVAEPILSISLWSGNRVQINYTEDQIRGLFTAASNSTPETYKDMSDQDFIDAVMKDIRSLANPGQLKTNKYEPLSRHLVLMYHVTGDWEYARKAAMILYYQAQYYPHLLKNKENILSFGENVVYTFGFLLNKENNGKSVWEDIAPSGISEAEVKGVIANLYLRPLATISMDQILGRRLGNLDVYAARSAAVTASIINDPYLIRKVIMMYDLMFNGEHYYFDNMWEEGTLSYGGQVTNNALSGIQVLSKYTDPEGYTDPVNPEDYGLYEGVMGLKLENTELSSRWTLFDRAKDIPTYMLYPDASPIAVNDTHYKADSSFSPIKEEHLSNIELPGFGYYGLVQGNTENAVHAGLLYQAKQGFFGGSHDHINVLSMTLWGAGTELLPDVGYVTATNYPSGGGRIRYPAMRPVFGNMPWIFMDSGINEESNLGWFKPRLLAYDDGQDNGGLVNLVEASDVGPDKIKVDVDQRLLMNVELDDSHSYVFDLTRMEGGNAHAIFQRGSELENMTTVFNEIQFTETGKDNLFLVEPFASYASQFTIQDMKYLYTPKEADGSKDFSFVWKGEETGSRVTTYMNGVSDSMVYLSSIPTPRRINSKDEEKTKIAPHLTRYNTASSSELTKYGAVHETAKVGEEDLIESVEWLYPSGIDSMGILGKITSQQYIDYIYTSGDTEIRTLEGIQFAGKIAMVRKDRTTDEIIYSYVYGEGTANKTEGSRTQKYEVVKLTTAPILDNGTLESVEENTITVSGKITDAQSYVGKRVQLVFGDGSGYGVKVRSIEEFDGKTELTTEEYVPAKFIANGVELLFTPTGQKISGKVFLILEKDTTGTGSEIEEIYIEKLPEKTVYNVGEEFDSKGLVVVASCSDAQQVELLPTEYEIDDSKFNSDQEGRYPIKVSYTPDPEKPSVKFQVSFNVEVVEAVSELYVDGIKVTKKPDTLDYEIGDMLNPEGMVVTRYRKSSASNANRIEDELLENDYSLDYDFETAGQKKVTVSYTGIGKDGEEIAFTDSFNATVQAKTKFSITLTPSNIDLKKGNTKQLKATVIPENTVYDNIIWSTDKPQIAKVSNTGFVTAVGAGTATITAALDGVKTTCVATVTDKVILNPSEAVEEIDTIADKVSGILNNSSATTEEKKKVISDAIDRLTNKGYDQTDLPPAIETSLSTIEDALIDTIGHIKSTEVVSDDSITDVKVTGAAINIPIDIEADAKALLTINKTTAPESVPIKVSNSLALDIKLNIESTDSSLNQSNIQPKAPLIITMDIPKGISKDNLVIVHYHNNKPLIIKPTINGNEMTFITTQLSVFLVANEVKSTPTGGSSSDRGESITTSGRWIKDNTGWWFSLSNGSYYKNQWALLSNKWYYFNEAGYMQTGWVFVNGKWYYMQEDGAMLSNNWLFYNNKWYYLSADGTMAVSTTTPDGYLVDESGIWK